VFFGANDAALPQAQNNQHIPLAEYKQNLEKIITHPSVTVHDARIILVAPPPVNEHLQWQSDRLRGHQSVCRLASVTKTYADAASQVGERLGLPVVNLWNAFMSKASFSAENWKMNDPLPGSLSLPQSEALVKLMYDGRSIHCNPYEDAPADTE
jgi:lysophospholipase L1-like esterase